MRRYDDTIDVRLEGGPEPETPGRRSQQVQQQVQQQAQPAAFVWRGRLYVVRAVQTRWYERRAWWREAAAAALLGLRGDEQAGAGRPTDVPGGDDGDHLDHGDYLDGETEVWRVEASAGRTGPVGVFDLARSVPAPPAAPAAPAIPAMPARTPTGWRLTRVAD